ncbi:hypothetical protein BpHYR1_042449 [Brachionus plicatilis]|uniref:Uncharacterized protein n=1 Tax=Brachionus plicatilis TaxID=10195 RepID=A0A3M7QX33_BRAPC|nr:hypothetical protein BpHYR1_042449 [Brachionus plicatilis]
MHQSFVSVYVAEISSKEIWYLIMLKKFWQWDQLGKKISLAFSKLKNTMDNLIQQRLIADILMRHL